VGIIVWRSAFFSFLSFWKFRETWSYRSYELNRERERERENMSRLLKHSNSVPVIHVDRREFKASSSRLSRRKTNRKISKKSSFSEGRKESKSEKWMKLAESSNGRVANFSLPRPDGNANSLSTSQYVTFYKAGPILLTCPHSIRLKRDDHEDHRPEPLVLDLIKIMTIEYGPTKASSIFWSHTATKNFSNNRDPNYLHIKELKSNPWHNCLQIHQQRHGPIAMHFDFHGMRGKKYGSDLALGVEPLERFLSEEPYAEIPHVLTDELRSILEPRGFVVKQVSSMTGFRSTQRMTLSQQSVMCLKVPAVQIEISMKLREALLEDRDMRKQFRAALVECYKTYLY